MEVDGYYGPETERRVYAFQEGYALVKLVPDGQAGPRTRREIICSAANNGRLSKNFYFGEFRSQRSGEIRVRRELPERLERLRAAQLAIRGVDDWAMPILTGYRDPRTSDQQSRQGISQSRHLQGEAVNIPTYYGLRVDDMLPGTDQADGPASHLHKIFSGIGYYQRTGLVRHLDVAGTHEGSLDTSKSPHNPRLWPYDPDWDPDDFDDATVIGPEDLRRSDRHGQPIFELNRPIDGSALIVGQIPGDLQLTAKVAGNLTVSADIEGDVTLSGRVKGSVWLPAASSDVVGSDAAGCNVGGSLNVRSKISGELVVSCPVGAFTRLWGSVGGSFRFEGHCGRSLMIKHGAKVGQNFWVTGGYDIGTLDRHINDGRTPKPYDGRNAIDRDLIVDGSVAGDVGINGAIGGSVWINQKVVDLIVAGVIRGDLRVLGKVRNLSVWHDGTDVRFSNGYNHGAVERDLWIEGEVSNTLWLTGRVGRRLLIDGDVGKVNIEGVIQRGYFYLAEKASAGSIVIASVANIEQGTWIQGRCAEDILIRGDFGEHLFFNGTAQHLDVSSTGGKVWLDGFITGGGRIRHERGLANVDPLVIQRLATRVGAPLFLGTGVSLEDCDFRYFTDYHQLRLVGAGLFRRVKGRRQLSFTYLQEENDKEKADIYRRLRNVLEAEGNRAGAGDFYFGELQARRRAARRRWQSANDRSILDGAEWLILVLYRTLSGYGLSASRPLVAFVALLVLAGAGFTSTGLILEPAMAPATDPTPAGWPGATVFALQSMVSPIVPPSAELGPWGRLLQTTCRLLGPLFLAQAFLAIRERVAR